MGLLVMRLLGPVAVLVLLAGCADRSGTPPSRPSTSLAGTSWRLVGVRDGGRSVPPPAHPRLDFGRDGSIGLDDTVNALSARYRPDGNGLTITQAGTTLVGYVGTDHRRLTTIAAVDSIAFRFSHGTSLPSSHVAIARTGAALVITSQRYQLTYRAAGVAPNLTPLGSATADR